MKSETSGQKKKRRSVAWKALERTVASFFATTRAALSGGNGKVTRSDSHHGQLYIECKYGQRVAPWKLFKGSEEKAKAEGKTCVLALKERNEDGFFVVCRSRDLQLVSRLAAEGDKDEQD